jgi:hypothetical protein
MTSLVFDFDSAVAEETSRADKDDSFRDTTDTNLNDSASRSHAAIGYNALDDEAIGDEAIGDEAIGDEAIGDEAIGDESSRSKEGRVTDESSQVVDLLIRQVRGSAKRSRAKSQQEGTETQSSVKERRKTTKPSGTRTVHKSNAETMKKATDILGAVKVMYDNKDTTTARSSYAFETVVPDVST